MRFFFLFISALLVFCAPSFAQDRLPMANFKDLPVQHDGRIKPLDTFARQILSTLSGRESIDDMNAAEWLAEALFDPASSIERRVFLVTRPALFHLPPRKGRLFSFSEISPVLAKNEPVIASLSRKDPKEWSEDQREFIRLHEAGLIYTQLLRSFSFMLPLNIDIPEKIAREFGLKAGQPFTLAAIDRHQAALDKKLQSIIRKKGTDESKYTDAEMDIAVFARNAAILRQSGEQNVFLRIIPAQWGERRGEWLSPWAATQSGQASAGSVRYLDLWEDMANAYLMGDASAWTKSSASAVEESRAFTDHAEIIMERLYAAFHPLHIALLFYFGGFLAFLAATLHRRELWQKISAALVCTGLASHIAAIALRIAILDRAPVATLYESIIFVAAVCVGVFMLFERRSRDSLGLLGACVTGMLLLCTALGFSEADTMKILVAVLNTNFWLSTHVLCITTGYGFCIITSLMAHVWLVKSASGKDAAALDAPIKTMALISLLFTAVGTILGGIWADQSWGRFWGWDPKENGALLIVLWLIWVLHGRLSGHFKAIHAIAAYAALSIVVAIAWFGVNLLNVGLHSYGFISGVAGSLAAFVIAELGLISFLWHKTVKKEKA